MRVAAALGGAALVGLLLATIVLLLMESTGGLAAMSDKEYKETRWTPGAAK